MSKDRLRLLELSLNHAAEYAILTEDELDDLICYFNEQTERVQEMERTNSNLGYLVGKIYGQGKFDIKELTEQNKRYREALEEIMKIQENHEWNLYGLAYGIAERTLFELEGEE